MERRCMYFMRFPRNTLYCDMDQCAGAISAFVGHRCRVAINAADGNFKIEFMATERILKKIKEHMNWMLDSHVKYVFT